MTLGLETTSHESIIIIKIIIIIIAIGTIATKSLLITQVECAQALPLTSLSMCSARSSTASEQVHTRVGGCLRTSWLRRTERWVV